MPRQVTADRLPQSGVSAATGAPVCSVPIKRLGVRVFKSAINAFAVAAGIMIFPSLALACEGGKTLFEDKFAKLNPAWGFSLDPATEKIDPSGYAVDFPPNAYRRGLSQVGYYNDYVACATFTVNFTCTNKDACRIVAICWARHPRQ